MDSVRSKYLKEWDWLENETSFRKGTEKGTVQLGFWNKQEVFGKIASFWGWGELCAVEECVWGIICRRGLSETKCSGSCGVFGKEFHCSTKQVMNWVFLQSYTRRISEVSFAFLLLFIVPSHRKQLVDETYYSLFSPSKSDSFLMWCFPSFPV